jgi:hypothetical protein
MTRLGHAVLIAIVALAFVSSFGFSMLSDMIQQARAALSKITAGGSLLKQRFAFKFEVQGDPIKDPKPNNK